MFWMLAGLMPAPPAGAAEIIWEPAPPGTKSSGGYIDPRTVPDDPLNARMDMFDKLERLARKLGIGLDVLDLK